MVRSRERKKIRRRRLAGRVASGRVAERLCERRERGRGGEEIKMLFSMSGAAVYTSQGQSQSRFIIDSNSNKDHGADFYIFQSQPRFVMGSISNQDHGYGVYISQSQLQSQILMGGTSDPFLMYGTYDFMICEHKNLIEPDRVATFPRFCKWNTGSLICKTKGLDLTCMESLQVNYDKLCKTILERYTLSVSNDEQMPIRNENVELVVQMEEHMHEICNVVVDLENTEPSFDYWKPNSPNDGHVDSEPPRQVRTAVSKVVQQTGKRCGRMAALDDCLPNLFPNLIELSSTPATKGDGDSESLVVDLKNVLLKNKELKDGNRRKSIRINELEARVDVMERMIGAKAVNMFIGFENVIIAKDVEIARLSTLVTQLDGKVATLQDHLDDHEMHAVAQATTKNESCERQPSGDKVEKHGSCNNSHINRSERSSVNKTPKTKSTVPMGAVCIDIRDAVEVDSSLKQLHVQIPHESDPQQCPPAVVMHSFADCAGFVGRDANANLSDTVGAVEGLQRLLSGMVEKMGCVSNFLIFRHWSNNHVTDAYTVTLTDLQRKCVDEDSNMGTYYFFSSICAKQWVVKYHNHIVGVGVRTTNVAPPYIDGILESVIDCPQQVADTADCAMIVCFLMQQYVHNVRINTTMDGVMTIAYYASMVKIFVNDLVGGLCYKAI
ncbi:hypothetical protein LOK49_LG08G02226 [Camellia lanceoleosa]|uniref:Uncharacterized protein n=1 Tax=Camellia lanceoleosa TaxID=1840588 RepID=A0ACC0GUP6_9ERIC|nr:hypothetical protein LOK49_LG08G02226 [Camellia lanceoleosa]